MRWRAFLSKFFVRALSLRTHPMVRFLKRLVFALILAALAAAGWVLWSSADPAYTFHSWLAGSRFARYDPIIGDLAKKHGVDPLLIKAIVWRESSFHPDKIGTVGERGLMQVGEAAAKDWALAEKIETFIPTDLFDPKTNVEVGTWYFKQALERWKRMDDPVPFALAEYNAGRSRVDRWIIATGRGDQATARDLVQAIDFPTTRRYVEDIVARYRFYQTLGQVKTP
jgi:soluble lytic murein transglycosylase